MKTKSGSTKKLAIVMTTAIVYPGSKDKEFLVKASQANRAQIVFGNLEYQQITGLFKMEVLEGFDSSVKEYARKYLPALENNLKMFHNSTSGLMKQTK